MFLRVGQFLTGEIFKIALICLASVAIAFSASAEDTDLNPDTCAYKGAWIFENFIPKIKIELIGVDSLNAIVKPTIEKIIDIKYSIDIQKKMQKPIELRKFYDLRIFIVDPNIWINYKDAFIQRDYNIEIVLDKAYVVDRLFYDWYLLFGSGARRYGYVVDNMNSDEWRKFVFALLLGVDVIGELTDAQIEFDVNKKLVEFIDLHRDQFFQEGVYLKMDQRKCWPRP